MHYLLGAGIHRRHVEMLRRHGADPALESKGGQSPLDLVANRRNKTYLNLSLSSRALPE